MTDRKELVARALTEAQILKELKARHAETRAELAQFFEDAGDREVGKLLDQRIGTVSLEAGSETWKVTDEETFLQWVKQEYPQHITQTVGSVFRDWVLIACKAHGGLLDADTGEVEVVPGVEKRVGAPTLVERPDKDAGKTVREWLGVETAERLGIEDGK
jgi:hypothetical protein